MNLYKNKILLVVCFLLVGIILIYMGYIKANEPLEYSIDDTTIAMIDLTSKNKKINVVSILGIASILFAAFLVVPDLLNRPRKNAIVMTPQEKRIVSYIQSGMTNKEIASELSISMSTVKTHNNNIYKKLGINSREDLMNKG